MPHAPTLTRLQALALAALLCASPISAAPILAPDQKIEPSDTPAMIIEKAANTVPSPRQLAYHREEFIAFIHFGPNTFTGKEWGDGMEAASAFAPAGIDTDQWCEKLKAAGVRKVVMTFKHHDGYVLWQSRYETKQSIKSSPFQNGKGDIARDLSASCRKYGLKFGVYISPADLYQIESKDGYYGNGSKAVTSVIPTDPAAFKSDPTKVRADRPAGGPTFSYTADDYNRYMLNQLYELLTEYGPVHEVWFDGATPKSKGGQKYTYADWYALIRKLAPDAIIFGKGPDARWCGNEAGGTRASEWNVIPLPTAPEVSTWNDMTGADLGSRGKLKGAKYLHYYPAETNTSIRHGWFYRDDTHQTVRTPDDVFDIYERSVGGNSIFMLNIPPNKDGRFSPRDADCLVEVGRRIRETYGTDLAKGGTISAPGLADGDIDTFWQPAGTTGEIVVTLPKAAAANRFLFQEALGKQGQRIEKHALDAWLDGKWTEVASGTTVGYKKILRFPTVTTDRFRLRILESRLSPTVSEVSVHHYARPPLPVLVKRDARGGVTLAPDEPRFTGKGAGYKTTGLTLRYTLDGKAPDAASPAYTGTIPLPEGGRVRARSFSGDLAGEVATRDFGPLKTGWKFLADGDGAPGAPAVDDNTGTYWVSEKNKAPATLVLDLGKPLPLTAFTYLPPQDGHAGEGILERGEISTSIDGTTWQPAGAFEFGNLINDPAERTQFLSTPRSARFLRLSALRGAQGANTVGAAEIGVLTHLAK